MNNEAKPTSSMNNQAKISFGETWATVTTTWASEIRTWQQIGSLINNSTKITSSMSNFAKP